MSEKKIEKTCRYCGKKYQTSCRGNKGDGFCSNKCAYAFKKEFKPFKYQHKCEYCGIEYRSHIKNQKYCSPECAQAVRRTGRTVYKKICPYCGEEFETIYPRNKFCTSTCASRYYGDLRRGEYFCEYCGKPRFSDHPNKHHYCSQSCATKARYFENAEAQAKEMKAREEEAEKMRWRTCKNCGKIFYSTNGHLYCSENCRTESLKAVAREKYAASYEERSAGYIPRTFVCAECGCEVTTSYGDMRTVFCSEACQVKAATRAYNHIRKQQMRAAFVEPVGLKETYRRAGGVCAICGLPVPNTFKENDFWGATRDHIDPLSQGGLHMKSNCQLAHRICNSLKGTSGEDFKIDWKQKLIEEPGRWNERLDDLWEQLGMQDESQRAG